MDTQKSELREAERRQARSQQQQTEAIKTLGRLEAQESEHARKKTDLAATCVRLADLYGLRIDSKSNPVRLTEILPIRASLVLTSPLIDFAQAGFVDSVNTYTQRKREELNAHKTEAHHTDARYESALATFRSQEAMALAELKSKKSVRDDRINKLRELQREVTRMEAALAKLTTIQTDIRTAEDELKAFIQRTCMCAEADRDWKYRSTYDDVCELQVRDWRVVALRSIRCNAQSIRIVRA